MNVRAAMVMIVMSLMLVLMAVVSEAQGGSGEACMNKCLGGCDIESPNYTLCYDGCRIKCFPKLL